MTNIDHIKVIDAVNHINIKIHAKLTSLTEEQFALALLGNSRSPSLLKVPLNTARIITRSKIFCDLHAELCDDVIKLNNIVFSDVVKEVLREDVDQDAFDEGLQVVSVKAANLLELLPSELSWVGLEVMGSVAIVKGAVGELD